MLITPERYTKRRKREILEYFALCTPYQQQELMRIHEISHSELASWQHDVTERREPRSWKRA